MTHYLTLGDIIDIRDRIAVDDAWRFEIVNASGLLSALTTPFQSVFGQDSFPTLVDKAGALVFLLIANHPFRDGNKRIAGAALRLFLERNGRPLQADRVALEHFTVRVAQAHLRDAFITAWISDRSSTRDAGSTLSPE